jgi:carboxymethylenebutenolidase
MTEHKLDGGFPVYVAGSTDAPRAVIVVQEAFGVNGHIRSVVDRFADAGYFSIAPQLFHRDGSPEVPYDNFDDAMKYMANLSKDGITNDLNATTDFLSTLGYQQPNIGVVGYCMGGTVSFVAATIGNVGAAVSFYGGGLA